MARPNDNLPDLIDKSRVVQVVSYDNEWTTALDVQLNVTAAHNSPAYNIAGSVGAIVAIFIDSTGAPTNMRVLAQFSHDNGVTWNDFEEGLWASLYWEDTDTAAGINKTFTLPCSGQDVVRFRVVGVGTTGAAYFDTVVRFRAFRGAYAGAHA